LLLTLGTISAELLIFDEMPKKKEKKESNRWEKEVKTLPDDEAVVW